MEVLDSELEVAPLKMKLRYVEVLGHNILKKHKDPSDLKIANPKYEMCERT